MASCTAHCAAPPPHHGLCIVGLAAATGPSLMTPLLASDMARTPRPCSESNAPKVQQSLLFGQVDLPFCLDPRLPLASYCGHSPKPAIRKLYLTCRYTGRRYSGETDEDLRVLSYYFGTVEPGAEVSVQLEGLM